MTARLGMVNYFLAKGVLLEVFINDLPLAERPLAGQRSSNEPVNHLLVPGDNTLDVFIHKAPDYWEGKDSIRFIVFKEAENAENPQDVEIVHELHYPAVVEDGERAVPFHYRATFQHGLEISEPPHLAAAPQDFDHRGTPELRQAVERVHDALSKDVPDDYLDLAALRLGRRERAFAGHAMFSLPEVRKEYEEFFGYERELAALDLDTLHFEPRCGGRVAYVRRVDIAPAVVSRTTDGSDFSLEPLLLFMKEQEQWRLY